MIKKIIIIICLLSFSIPAFAVTDEELIQEQTIQNRIDDIGAKILNANKIPDRVIFVYNKEEKKSKLKMDTTLSSRQILMYDNSYKFIENDDELAAYLARGIALATRSFNGIFAGGLKSIEMKAAPKKYQIVTDKIAVDYMVNAGYHPVALITYLQKTAPQRRFDRFSNQNLTSKRLAIIYEYIYTKYPYYLVNNPYFENEHYQNFLLTSVYNRKLLKEKIETGSKEKIKYE